MVIIVIIYDCFMGFFVLVSDVVGGGSLLGDLGFGIVLRLGTFRVLGG